MAFFTLKDFDFKDKRVLLRVDFNVPLDKKGNITDDNRIRASLPTINYLLEKGARIIIMSHLGRPEGKAVKELRMDKVAKALSKLLGRHVAKLDDCVKVKLPENDVVLLENLRFHKEEETNNREFSKKLASLGKLYVNDAFGACHRAHASVSGVTYFIPSAAGLLLEKERGVLSELVETPEKPFVAVLGGAKISDKLALIYNLLKKVDKLLLGGAMIFTFFKAQGYEVGNSLVEDGEVCLVEELMFNEKIILPVDVVIGEKMARNSKSKTVSLSKIPKSWMGLDIGEKTIELFRNELEDAKTIIWNGPLGAFEYRQFASGTDKIAKFISESDARTIIGGGDTAFAVEKAGLTNKMDYVSTGGGAFLEFLEGRTLPGIYALEENYKRFSSELIS